MEVRVEFADQLQVRVLCRDLVRLYLRLDMRVRIARGVE